MEERVLRVLVIEDSSFKIDQIKTALQTAGYDFVVANTGIQGLKLDREVLPDLILLDRVLPDMNGPETCRHLRGQDELRGTPIIIVTVKEKTEDKVSGLGILERVGGATFPILGKKHRVAVSIGVAGFPDPELRDARQAILASDFALYRAKRAGGNRVETMTVAEMESA